MREERRGEEETRVFEDVQTLLMRARVCVCVCPREREKERGGGRDNGVLGEKRQRGRKILKAKTALATDFTFVTVNAPMHTKYERLRNVTKCGKGKERKRKGKSFFRQADCFSFFFSFSCAAVYTCDEKVELKATFCHLAMNLIGKCGKANLYRIARKRHRGVKNRFFSSLFFPLFLSSCDAVIKRA